MGAVDVSSGTMAAIVSPGAARTYRGSCCRIRGSPRHCPHPARRSRSPGDTIAAIVPLDTSTAPIDTIPADTAQLIVEPPPPTVAESHETIFDRRRTNQQVVQDVLRAYVHQPYRPLRAGEFYAAGFLTEEERLPWGRILVRPPRRQFPGSPTATSATTFQEIAIRPPRNASYHVGDSLLLARIDRTVEFGRWGDVVVPVGIARVSSIEEQQVLAQVLAQFAPHS